ncbi:MAG: 4Fe-4S dicluster domain-containing protein [Planctomycetota bacterium]|nr:4Fe-4S dicluster domain-containing protein [Planctomycetota bacterium]
MNYETSKPDNVNDASGDGARAADVDLHGGESPEISRRRFLEAAGFTFSFVALNGCSRPTPELALPFTEQPEGMIPGQSQSYASTCAGCPAGCGLLGGVRDGRPLKMEGMPEHPLSKGGLCAIGQALPLGLYDSHRLKHPLQRGEQAEWKQVDQTIIQTLEKVDASGGAVRFVTSTITSPTLRSSIDAFLKRFSDARHISFDSLSCSAILDAHEKTHGARLLPHYRLEDASVIVSFGADFLGTWISPVEFTAAWRTRRVPTAERPEMSYHAHFEGRMSLTGSNADRRFRLAPDEFGVVLSHLYVSLAERSGEVPQHDALTESPLAAADLAALAERLWAARGESLVLCDSQDVAVQVLVNAINYLLGNYGKTVDIARPSRQRQGSDRDLLELIDELRAGKVSALFVAGTDLTHNLPGHDTLAEAIGKVELVVSFAERQDDFASLAHFVCPDHHSLEAWMDAEPVSGLVSLSQPMLQPLGKTRSILESLARWSGHEDSAYDILRSSWETNILPRTMSTTATTLREFWDRSLHDGFVEVVPTENAATKVGDFDASSVNVIAGRGNAAEYCLTLYSKIGLTDSRHAHNPWLQELPDPVTKVTWDNYVSVSAATAEKLKLIDGDVVRVATPGNGASLELPTLIQRGQHDRVISIALGYGVKGTDRFAKVGPQWFEGRPTVEPGGLVGKNAASLIDPGNGSLSLVRSDVTLSKTDRRHDLASTQEYHSLEIPPNVAPHGAEVRDIVQKTSLPEFAKNPESGKPEHHFDGQLQLWPEDHAKEGHRWGMAIDMNACTGCSACLVACQSENNVPVVGKDEVRRQREMHWIRIDRYYGGDDDDVDVSHQPMMCQHCDNAPCETVCPVLATVHSDEGLNEQVYNRCVGTRYCANNCPYKVRRFNWFDYPHEDSLLNLSLNPDVAVRSRGVMEKCSMCVQRIEEGKIDAKRRGAPLVDGEIKTACQQSCPAQAIVFGDLNDAESAIHAADENPRGYGVLEEFNFRQSVSYLRVVRNRGDLQTDGGEHV